MQDEASEAARKLAASRKQEPKVCVRCGKEFVGHSWAKYCGPSCSSGVYWDKNREELNRKRRERYQRQKAGQL